MNKYLLLITSLLFMFIFVSCKSKETEKEQATEKQEVYPEDEEISLEFYPFEEQLRTFFNEYRLLLMESREMLITLENDDIEAEFSEKVEEKMQHLRFELVPKYEEIRKGQDIQAAQNLTEELIHLIEEARILHDEIYSILH